MRRRRLITSGPGGRQVPAQVADADLTYLEQVVCVRFPVNDARTYLRRHMGNDVRVHLTEARRGEAVGIVREVEVRHAASGTVTTIRARRLLDNGEPASHFVPDHLVRIEPDVQAPNGVPRGLHRDDLIVLRVPVRGYTRFLPAIFQGEGPIERRAATRVTQTALARARGVADSTHALEVPEPNQDFLGRLLFVFQHQMTTVTDRIDRLVHLTDPMTTDASFLPWLASWVGFELDGGLPVHQQRELVRRAIRLYRTRGTREGIEEMVGVLTTAPVRVRERARPTPFVLGRSHLADGGDPVSRYHAGEPAPCYLVAPEDHADTDFFILLLEGLTAFRDRFGARAPAVIRRILEVVSRERPGHVTFTLRFDDSV